MSQCNKLYYFQYARFQILVMYLLFGLFWSAGIPTMILVCHICNNFTQNGYKCHNKTNFKSSPECAYTTSKRHGIKTKH